MKKHINIALLFLIQLFSFSFYSHAYGSMLLKSFIYIFYIITQWVSVLSVFILICDAWRFGCSFKNLWYKLSVIIVALVHLKLRNNDKFKFKLFKFDFGKLDLKKFISLIKCNSFNLNEYMMFSSYNHDILTYILTYICYLLILFILYRVIVYIRKCDSLYQKMW